MMVSDCCVTLDVRMPRRVVGAVQLAKQRVLPVVDLAAQREEASGEHLLHSFSSSYFLGRG